MQFALPEHLKVAVAAYDPTLKVLARQQAKASKPRKTSFSLGLPDDLVPHDLLKASKQIEIAKEMHSKEAADRSTILRNYNDDVMICIVHHRSVWLAVWADKRQPDYVYGFSYAYKSAPSVASKVDPIVIKAGYEHREYLREKEVSVKYGRTEFMRYSTVITKEQIANGSNVLPWDGLLDRWAKASSDKWRTVSNFTNLAIKPMVPTFDDQHVFARMKAISEPAIFLWGGARYGEKVTVDSLANFVELPARIAETPFFRSELSTAVAEFNNRLLDPKVRQPGDVKGAVKSFMHRIDWVGRFLNVYPDAQIDYVQQIYNVCGSIHAPWSLRSDLVKQWLRENMPIASFVRICRTFAESKAEELAGMEEGRRRREIDVNTHFGDGFPKWRNNAFDDALSVLDNILQSIKNNPDSEIKLERPDRWRVNEFHDYLVGVSFKINNTNDPLPQDFFPEPIKIHDAEGKKWTFFQPADVHQLASWGQAVRNCVGSASSYREGIRRKTHFIILVMIDNKPQFTIQARVDNALFNVSQIAGISNRSLTDIERKTCEIALNEAIIKQNEIIKQNKLKLMAGCAA